MSGTEQATCQRQVTLCRGWLKQWIPEHAFGEGQRCPQISKGSRFWAHRWLLEKVQAKQQVLLDAIPKVPKVQSAWLLLLHCASARANYQFRVVRPGLVESFAESHDQGLWRCLCAILEVLVDTCDVVTRATATLPLSLGGLGLRSAERTKVAVCWASWADVLPMIQARHPAVAASMVQHLKGKSWSPSMEPASRAAAQLEGMAGFAVPQWSDLAGGLRPEQREPEVHEPGSSRAGWQHEASSRVQQDFRASCLFPHMSPSERALVRSQSEPGAGVALLTSPSSLLTRIESPLFRVLLQRRHRLPLLLSGRICRCGHSIDSHGHHRAACSRTGVLGRRGFALESEAARVCGEAGGRVAANLFVRAQHGSGVAEGRGQQALRGCLGWAVPSWQLTRRWSLHSRAMENQGEEPQIMMESHWQQLAETREGHTLNWSDLVHAHDWWFSLWKWAADGPRKPRSLWGCWQGLGPDQNHDSCDVALNKRGDSVGTESFHVPQQGRWVCGVGMGPMGKRLRLTRSSGIRQRPSVNERHHCCVVRVWMSF